MMNVITDHCFEDGGYTMMSRILGASASAIVQADISSISISVFDLDNSNSTAQAATALTVSSVVFNTLQTDARWTKDSTGYNFRYTIPASTFATGEHNYLAEVKFTPASGEVFWVKRKIYAHGVLTS